MLRTLTNRFSFLPVIVGLTIWLFVSIIPISDLLAKDNSSGFTFNPQSEYWPTKGWITTTPEQQGMSSEILVKIFDKIKTEQLNINSLLIVRNGYIVVEAHRHFAELLHPLYSSSKSVVSAVFGIALKEGYIGSTDETLLHYFPEISQKKDSEVKSSITIKHLLTMSCGFDWEESENYLSPKNPVYQMMNSPNSVQYVLDKPVSQKPGQTFKYNTGCTHLLFAALNRVGLKVSDFAQDRLFKPLGISNYNWNRDSNGIPFSLHMRTRDMAKFGYLYLKGGNWSGKQIVPQSWIEESTKKHIKVTWGRIAEYYGYKWYIHSFGFHSLGWRGQYIFVIPQQDLVVVFTSDLPSLKMEEPIHLVKSYVIPAVKASTTLPKNEKAQKILEEKSEKFEIF